MAEIERKIGAYLIDGHLFFRLLDGSSINCECIAGPYAERVVEFFHHGKIPSMLKNARNILKDGGYLYADEIDKALED